MDENPFMKGDLVIFVPDQHTTGWHQHSFERWGLIPGSSHTVSAVRGNKVEVDGNSDATMHWSQFKSTDAVSQDERSALEAEFKRRKR